MATWQALDYPGSLMLDECQSLAIILSLRTLQRVRFMLLCRSLINYQFLFNSSCSSILLNSFCSSLLVYIDLFISFCSPLLIHILLLFSFWISPFVLPLLIISFCLLFLFASVNLSPFVLPFLTTSLYSNRYLKTKKSRFRVCIDRERQKTNDHQS